MGSPCYMSPEQIATPHAVDARTDIWALGVVLYRLLTNAMPFDGDSVVQVYAHILNAAPLPPSAILPGVDEDLEAIVLRCLEKDPAARFASVSDVAAALQACLVKMSGGLVAQNSHDTLPDNELPLLDDTDIEVLDEPLAVARSIGASRAAFDDGPIEIPGVHSRWPVALSLAAVLLSGSLFEADRRGLVRVRDFTDGLVTPASLAVDMPRLDRVSPSPLFGAASARLRLGARGGT